MASTKRRTTSEDSAIAKLGATIVEDTTMENLADAGGRRMQREQDEYNAVSPVLTGGDLDADWQEAEDSGDETPGGHVATPDQDNVDEIGRAVGLEFQDNQELHTHAEVLEKRDRHRWELDRRSADDPSGIRQI
jgi:hypothetical protein